MYNFSEIIIQVIYYLAAILFIIGLKQMSSPKTAAGGVHWAGIGMLLAILVTFLFPNMHNLILIIAAIIVGSLVAWYAGKKVAMTAMPEMIALYNGMGGGAAAAIAAVELFGLVTDVNKIIPTAAFILAAIGALIGAISFSGSIFAFIKLRDWLKKAIYFPMQQAINICVLLAALILGAAFYVYHTGILFSAFFIVSLIYGILMTIPIGGADMPVVIALYNALTGLAVACEGFVLNNVAMIIAGTVVGASGTLLTQLMAKAMNRSIGNILFARFGATSATEVTGTMKSMEASDAAMMLNYVQRVVIIPGYGMAVAQAQQKVWEFASLLIDKGIDVRFAIHPVAGRMPGHMNVLLAEAGVPYDYIHDMNDINNDFASTDVVIVIGANDVVNPSARTDKNSPIYGMPILNADYAKQIFVIKRGKGAGYAGVENTLFYNDKTRMIYGDAKNVIVKMIQTLKEQE
jgi:H+-translocating NAD(P) transhydrogenase subunit beta